MSDLITISIASQADVPALVRLVNSAYRGDSSKKGWTTEADLLDGIRTEDSSLLSIIEKTENVILIGIEPDGNIIACVHLQKQANKIYLGMLTVSPELQAAGIGKKLLIAAEDYAKSNAINIITMTVISVRTELIAWYERRGFMKTGETKPFPQDPKFGLPKQHLEFVVLEKIL
jgi:ribosomal protein S18 acetylase RimI-like enzyme